MSNNAIELDLTPNPRREIGEKILSVSNSLFESVKNAPLLIRTGFPTVLRNNNFALAVRVTRNYAFLDVTTKLRARRDRDADRAASYRQFFSPKDSGQPALISIDRSRLCRFSGMTLEGAHAFSIGSDFSLCTWDTRNATYENGRRITHSVDALYVVGFGEQIREDDAWQEFDALIRVTLADWSAAR